MVILYAVLAVAIIGASAYPFIAGYAELDDENRLAVIGTVAITAWPPIMTFFLGPILLGGPSSALFPSLWYAPALAVLVITLARNVNRPGLTIDLPVALILTVSASALFPILAGHGKSDLLRWGLGATLLLLTLTKGTGVSVAAVALGCRIALVSISVSVLAAILLNPAIVVACREDKCGSAGRVLTSDFAGNGNVLGLTVALILPFAVVGVAWYRAAGFVVGVLLIGELAGSRTAFIGVGIVVAMHFALRVARGRMRSAVLGIGLVSALLLSLAPAALRYGDASFSYRGMLWNNGKQMIAQRPFIGHGPLAWEHFGLTTIFDANYSPHNAWLDMTVSVGIWGVVVVVGAVMLKLFLVSRAEREVLIVYLCGVIGACTLESLFVPYFFGIIPFTAILPLYVGPGRLAFEKFSRAKVSDEGGLRQPEGAGPRPADGRGPGLPVPRPTGGRPRLRVVPDLEETQVIPRPVPMGQDLMRPVQMRPETRVVERPEMRLR